MKFLNNNGQNFLIAHFQGRGTAELNYPAIDEFMNRKVVLPEDLQIISIITKRYLRAGALLDAQLSLNDIDYINTAKDYIGEWNNTMKIDFILEALEKVDSEYALILDGTDVLLAGDVTSIIERFNEYDIKVLFGATKNNYPNEVIDKVSNRDWLGEFKYLNAGTSIGKKDDLINFYTKVKELKKSGIDNPVKSEQFLVRHVFSDNQDSVAFDYKCNIFQTFSKAYVFHPDGDSSVAIVR